MRHRCPVVCVGGGGGGGGEEEGVRKRGQDCCQQCKGSMSNPVCVYMVCGLGHLITPYVDIGAGELLHHLIQHRL